jgi:hypothetical protein
MLRKDEQFGSVRPTTNILLIFCQNMSRKFIANVGLEGGEHQAWIRLLGEPEGLGRADQFRLFRIGGREFIDEGSQVVTEGAEFGHL